MAELFCKKEYVIIREEYVREHILFLHKTNKKIIPLLHKTNVNNEDKNNALTLQM